MMKQKPGGLDAEWREDAMWGTMASANDDKIRPLPLWADFAVFDPARCEPADLAGRISPATWLLLAFELRRAAQLSATALGSLAGGGGGGKGLGGSGSLCALFCPVGAAASGALPAVLPESCK